MALTFDDLPVARYADLAAAEAVLPALAEGLHEMGVPATGFLNESKVDVPGEYERRAALLEGWLEAGLDMGNHTRSHRSFWTTPLPDYQRDVEDGEATVARLLAARGRSLRYFRHPYLNTGPDSATRAAFEAYLQRSGYTVAPVTIDTDDYVFALAYDNVLSRRDTVLAERIGAAYGRYLEDVTAFYEALSEDVIGREVAQIMLLHANALNARYLPATVAMLRRRGYTFVSLEQALGDPAYQLPDRYVGAQGISWLHRWAITRGDAPPDHPPVPVWVRTLAWPD